MSKGKSLCRHTGDVGDQRQLIVIKLSEMTKTPLSHPDRRSVNINLPVGGNADYEALLESATSGPNSIAPLTQQATGQTYGVTQ